MQLVEGCILVIAFKNGKCSLEGSTFMFSWGSFKSSAITQGERKVHTAK